MKTVGIVLAYVVGAYLVVRAVVELVTVDYGDSTSYEDDWGGPTLVGVLAVHCLPGLLALALMIWGVRRLRRRSVR
jgi:hypothetical protein